MDEKDLPPTLDGSPALANPERRLFLEMMIAGAAAVPLLSSTKAAAQGGMEPFLGEIRCFGFGKIPSGWLACNGQTLAITQYQALYSLLGNQFGGNGTTNFSLPDLRGTVPVHYNPSAGLNVASKGGAETVTLTAAQMGTHTHSLQVNNGAGTTVLPSGDFIAGTPAPHLAYNAGGSLVATAMDNVGTTTGGGAAHSNMQPSLAVNFCIATQGLYPTRP
jgi:microcystin-dependent protein